MADAARKARLRERDELLRAHEKEGETFKGITAAIDYTPLALKIKHTIYGHWHIVSDIPGYKEPPRIGLRRTKSIRNLVMRSDIREEKKTQPVTKGHFRCGNCSCCPQAWETKVISLLSVGFEKHLDFQCVTHVCVYI